MSRVVLRNNTHMLHLTELTRLIGSGTNGYLHTKIRLVAWRDPEVTGNQFCRNRSQVRTSFTTDSWETHNPPLYTVS